MNGFASTTAFLASREASSFTTGLVANLFDSTSATAPGLNSIRSQLGLQPYDETSVNELLEVVNEGWSNYNSLLLTLRHTGTKFTFDVNYTFSKSLDTDQGVQNDSSTLANPLVPGVDYGPSKFDHKQIFNALFVYNLPTKFSVIARGLEPGCWRMARFGNLHGAQRGARLCHRRQPGLGRRPALRVQFDGGARWCRLLRLPPVCTRMWPARAQSAPTATPPPAERA